MKANDSFSGAGLERGKLEVGAYVFKHNESGKFYVGSTGRFKRRRKEHITLLRSNAHPVTELQELYNRSPHFTFYLTVTGTDSEDEDAREKAYSEEQRLLDEYWGDPLLLNYSKNARKNEFDGWRLERQLNILDAARSDPKRGASIRKAWDDPAFREHHSQRLRDLRQTDQARQVQSTIATSQWQNPEFRAKMEASRSTPEYLEHLRNLHAKSRKKLIAGGQEFDSVTAAAIALGITRNAVKRRCRSDAHPDYTFPF